MVVTADYHGKPFPSLPAACLPGCDMNDILWNNDKISFLPLLNIRSSSIDLEKGHRHVLFIAQEHRVHASLITVVYMLNHCVPLMVSTIYIYLALENGIKIIYNLVNRVYNAELVAGIVFGSDLLTFCKM